MKLQAKEAKLSEKEAAAAAEEAKGEGEEDYKAEIEASDGELKFKREEMDAAGFNAAKKASDAVKKYYVDKQKARAKAIADDLAEKIRLYKIEQAESEVSACCEPRAKRAASEASRERSEPAAPSTSKLTLNYSTPQFTSHLLRSARALRSTLERTWQSRTLTIRFLRGSTAPRRLSYSGTTMETCSAP